MNIKDVIQMKLDLERALWHVISDKVRDFQTETGLNVKSIDVHMFEAESLGDKTILSLPDSVKLEVSL
jgi:hypothetical protein